MMKSLLVLLFVTVTCGQFVAQDGIPSVQSFFPNEINSNDAVNFMGAQIQKNQILNSRAEAPEDFIARHGYPVEKYYTTTPDGYILALFRIRHGRNDREERVRTPVLVQHGLMSSAMDFLVTGPQRALGFILADAGYDVWLGNTRGSTYSRNHTYLSPNSKQFWQYSWHEIGERDLPTEINFVLGVTGFEKLHYIGHSQGTTAFFVMASLNTFVQNKVETMHALAPIVYMKHLKSPFVQMLSPMEGVIKLGSQLGTGEFMAKSVLLENMGYMMCREKSAFLPMCVNAIYLMGGYGSNQLDPNQVEDILKYSPASSSVYQLLHYGQGVNTGRFAQYDYGLIANRLRYPYPYVPPNYNISNIKLPVALYYASNDWLADVGDVQRFARELPNLTENYNVKDQKFNHMDFCWGIDAKREVYDRVINVIKQRPVFQKKITSIEPICTMNCQ